MDLENLNIEDEIDNVIKLVCIKIQTSAKRGIDIDSNLPKLINALASLLAAREK